MAHSGWHDDTMKKNEWYFRSSLQDVMSRISGGVTAAFEQNGPLSIGTHLLAGDRNLASLV